ncbi:MAG: ABC transporter ATP-binding protein [Pseudomonadota bacterium]
MSLEFSHIAYTYGAKRNRRGETRALEDVSFTAPTGEITCLLGASGCGKSTLLGLTAGLLAVQEGRIALAGQVLAEPSVSPPPEARPVGLVFQDAALFPHMTLHQNIGFGLPKDQRGAGSDVIEAWLTRVGLGGLGGRYPHELSGGQQQRAALARAMAPEPQVLLMDEPFASVDIVLRRTLRRECRILLRDRGTTTILVTHDPDEALDIADRIAVMEAGRIVQFGTPQELYNAPAAPSVGAIFGGAQIVPAVVKDGGFESVFGHWPLQCALGEGAREGAEVDLLVQGRAVRLEPDKEGIPVRDVHPLGARARVLLQHSSGAELTAEVPQSAADHIQPGGRYRIKPDPDTVRVFTRG